MGTINHALFLAINAGSDNPPALVFALAVLCAKYLILLVPLHLMVIWAGGTRVLRFVALAGLGALLIALTINQAIGIVAYSPRPFLIGLGHQLIEHRPSSSLPSNHATVFFAYAATLMIFGRRGLAITFGLMGAMTAWSRIYLGIHFPADMLAAAVTSGIAAVASTSLMMRYGAVLLPRAEQAYGLVLARTGLARLLPS